jgi:hypothetical protein
VTLTLGIGIAHCDSDVDFVLIATFSSGPEERNQKIITELNVLLPFASQRSEEWNAFEFTSPRPKTRQNTQELFTNRLRVQAPWYWCFLDGF